jgi:flagellar basal body-associated protein FliL
MTSLNVTSAYNTIIGPNASSWGGTVLWLGFFIFIPIFLLAIGMAVLWNIANYTKFKKYLGFLGDSFKYALIGLISLGVLSIPMGFIYWEYTNARAGNTVPLIWTLIIILVYAALALFGWFINKYVIERITNFEKKKKIKSEKKEGQANEKPSEGTRLPRNSRRDS